MLVQGDRHVDTDLGDHVRDRRAIHSRDGIPPLQPHRVPSEGATYGLRGPEKIRQQDPDVFGTLLTRQVSPGRQARSPCGTSADGLFSVNYCLPHSAWAVPRGHPVFLGVRSSRRRSQPIWHGRRLGGRPRRGIGPRGVGAAASRAIPAGPTWDQSSQPSATSWRPSCGLVAASEGELFGARPRPIAGLEGGGLLRERSESATTIVQVSRNWARPVVVFRLQLKSLNTIRRAPAAGCRKVPAGRRPGAGCGPNP